LPSELYIHKAVWYPEGYKVVASVNGNAIDGVSFVTSDISNYIQLQFTADALEKYNGKEVQVLVTRKITEIHMIPSTGYETNFSVTDLGNSAKCDFEAIFDPAAPKNVVYHIYDRNGVRQAEISEKSPKASLSCFDLAEGDILLVKLPEGFLDKTDVLMTQSLFGMNGKKVDLTLSVTETQI
jgi:hypothetical protein